ncbi:MAG: hypothetical protein U5O39_07965 [Gammaproteobacteria bacterium]|nr:hypothetical protein [Gammaproteobacteria bacterium]
MSHSGVMDCASATSCSRWVGSLNAAMMLSDVPKRMTAYQLGRRIKSRLGTAKLNDMSIGRVCTCGQTRAPRCLCSAISSHDAVHAFLVVGVDEQGRQRRRDVMLQAVLGELVDACER